MNRKGFTLIELLVVIAIIGVIASIVLVSVNSVRAKTRDAKRLADFEQIGVALELYYENNDGSYPIASSWGTDDGDNWQLLVDALSPDYISVVPQDPLFNGTYPWYGDAYHYRSSAGNDWVLVTRNEKLGFDNHCGTPYDGWCCGSWLIFCGR